MSDLTDLASALGAVSSGSAVLEVETRFTPKITINLADALTSGGPPSLFLRLLAPKVTLRAGAVVREVAPAGEPGKGGGWALLGLALVGGFLVWRAAR